jgi:hypothetical protein
VKKLIGKKEIEDALKRLDKLTQEEARMAAAENLRLSQIILNGTPSPVRYSGNIILNIVTHARWLDGKETKQVVQHLASSVDDIKCL